LEKANGLGEFDADSFARFIEVTGEVAGNDPAYGELIERLAEFVGSRKSEGEGALILLRRAQKLDLSDRFEMIRLLGKATLGLSKREYADSLIESAQLLAVAYQSAGLLWAARASCIFAAASIVIEGEEDGQLPVTIVPATKLWAWIALELGHLPDVLLALNLMNGFVAGLPLDEESRTRVRNDIRELDLALGCLFLNLKTQELRRLEPVPDILEALGSMMARTALLFALGYEHLLREDGSLPELETDEAVRQLLSTLKSQPIAGSFQEPLALNSEGRQSVTTTILGMRLEVEIEGCEAIVIAESVLGSLEAFFATTLEQRVAPHTESFKLTICLSADATEPTIETNALDMASIITWPAELRISRRDLQHDVRKFLAEVAAHVMGTAFTVKDAKSLLENLFTDEAVQQRIMLVAVSPNSFSRLTSQSFSRLSDWTRVIRRSYPLRDERPELPRIKLAGEMSATEDGDVDDRDVKDHKAVSVRSVIDMHAWDRAAWKGCGYLRIGFESPPYLAFLFEDEKAARKIFERWRLRFGAEDAEERIAISIIRQLPNASPHHYCVLLASRMPAAEVAKNPVLVVTRSMTMEPSNSQNLEMFLGAFEKLGCYYLVPAIAGGNPKFFFDLSIKKRSLTVKSATEIAQNDIEAIALEMRGLKAAS
jgi:hypothetical protein